MSLRVWLPLIKDLRNQGLDDISSLQLVSGNSFITGGKIGEKALNITKQQRILSNTSCMTGKKQMSYAFWVKVNTVWTTQWLDGIAWYSTDGTSASYSRQEFYNNCTKVGTWFKGSPNSLSGYDFNPEKWTHIAATFNYNTGEVKFYLNGELKGTSNSLSTSDYCRGDFYIGDNGLDILENDVRIYDHCLSPFEVKQISQGLVLHYPLNRGGWGQENLATCNTVQYNLTASTANWNYFWVTSSTALEPNTTYTFSAEVEVSDNYERCTIYNYTASGKSGEINYYFPADGKRHSWTFTTTSNALGVIAYAGTAGSTANYSAIYKKIKLEKGSIATPWCPNSSDALAITMGLNDDVEYDTSGYENNGTKVGTFDYDSDTPKYNISTVFNGVDNCIQIGNWYNLFQNPFTINVWFKKDEIGSKSYESLLGGGSGFEISTRAGNSQTLSLYLASVRGGTVYSPFNFTQWYMVTMVSDGTNEEFYVDGILRKTIEKKNMPNNMYRIGAWSSDTSQNFKGQMSDFRIYATALSEEDILSLYNNSAYIDNQGNIYGAVYEEV